MSTDQGGGSGGDQADEPIQEAREPTEEELRAAYEAQIKQLRVEHLVLENVVTLVNLGMRRTGLAPGTEDERDPEQVRLAIESVRALLPVLEQAAPKQVGAIKDGVSQLQLAFVRLGGQPEAPSAPRGGGEAGSESSPSTEPPPAERKEEAGPAQRSGRLWVPGQ